MRKGRVGEGARIIIRDGNREGRKWYEGGGDDCINRRGDWGVVGRKVIVIITS